MQKRESDRARMIIVCGVVLVAGLMLGRAGVGLSFADANAQFGQQPGSAHPEFGFAIPSGGVAIVKGTDGGAYVVDSNGMARRVLLSVQASAPDQPRQGNTVQLALD